MNISYKWLKRYIDLKDDAETVAKILTSMGLEVGTVEKGESIKGGLEGLVVGEVITCVEHPNSDHLHITTTRVAPGEEPIQIVCGAPNVAAGQKVIVATIGTKLYSGDECFTIKRGKIRGEESLGMICAEDEIGVGNSHDGIMVLPADTPVGMPAKEYFHVEDDTLIEVDITPNRSDGASHYGVARDLYAHYASLAGLTGLAGLTLKKPDVSKFKVDNAEADDVIACVMQDLDGYSLKVLLASDHDFLQIDGIHQFDLRGNQVKRMLADEELSAEDFLLSKLLLGDGSDNIPKVFAGVGPKKVLKLIKDHELLKEKLNADQASAKQYMLNKKLISFSELPKDLKCSILEKANQILYKIDEAKKNEVDLADFMNL